jgi:aryl sulfotransferase
LQLRLHEEQRDTGGADSFVNKGIIGRWRDTLTEKDIANYERTAFEQLGQDCGRWLATGEVG